MQVEFSIMSTFPCPVISQCESPKYVIRDIQIFCLQGTMEKHILETPLIWQMFTKWHATGASMVIIAIMYLGF